MKRALVGALVALCLLSAACKGDASRPGAITTTSYRPSTRPVRVGVWTPPDPAIGTYGGAAVRSLIYPQLFRATPAGRYEPLLVVKGSDKTGPGALTATIRLRANAKWTTGQPIGAEDLRRTMDTRFVSAVDGPTADGTITLRFTQKLPTWRRLWSGLDVIAPPPGTNAFGGPFVVAGATPNLETVLRANQSYWGERPRINEIHLVLVPDAEIAARLMERGALDVLAPPAFTDRTGRLERIKNAHVLRDATKGGGWTVAFVANPSHLTLEQRSRIVALADRARFTRVLLRGEVDVDTGPAVTATPSLPESDVRPSISAPRESAPSGLLIHAMQRTGRDKGIGFDLRQADFDDVLGAYARGDFDILYRLQPPTVATCWVCEAASVDAALAKAADAGDVAAAQQLRQRLVTDALVFPLWRERSVIAVRDGLESVSANGFSVLGPLWDAERWSWAG